MSAIEVIDRHMIYDNPASHNRSRHGYFPGLVKLPSGELLALFILGEAFEAANATTVVSRSRDNGQTWQLEGPLHEKEARHTYANDSMKPLLLNDGTLLATGYRFQRERADDLLVNMETDGLRAGDNIFSFSHDDGHTWSHPEVIPTTRPELVECSGPAVQLRRGTILTAGSLYPMWDGTNPSGASGVLLRSHDGGRSWDDDATFFTDKAGHYAPGEPRLCELQDDRVVALVWMTAHAQARNLANHVTVSHDGGQSWSDPIDTGVWGQASNLMHWEDDLLLTIHSQREGENIGIYVRLVDFAGDQWRTIEEFNIWDNAPAMQVAAFASMAANLKFGQPSLLRLDDGDVLASHWAVEDGQGRIKTHRLRVNL